MRVCVCVIEREIERRRERYIEIERLRECLLSLFNLLVTTPTWQKARRGEMSKQQKNGTKPKLWCARRPGYTDTYILEDE